MNHRTYDFNAIVPRRGSGCVKWDTTDPGVIPMWIADMDFKAADPIIEAINRRAAHGVFAYTQVTDEYYDAVIRWFARRHGWDIRRDWIQYTTGVVPAISCIIKALTMPGDKVLVTTPVYNCFFSSIRNNGCEVAESPLLVGKDGKYHFDWSGFEEQCADPKVVAYILCNPHNPGGRVWTREELLRITDICVRHHVHVISDEIHNELVMPGYTYIPFASVSAEALHHSTTCISASKSFNIAGLQMANIVCADPALSRRIDRAINIHEVCDVNPFAPVATIAAYNECEDWIEQLNQHIFRNSQVLQQRIDNESHGLLTNMPLEGTYLAWTDCSRLCQKLGCNVQELQDMLTEQAKVYLNAGTHYGASGEGFIRMNLACPQPVLDEALNRLFAFLKKAVQ